MLFEITVFWRADLDGHEVNTSWPIDHCTKFMSRPAIDLALPYDRVRLRGMLPCSGVT